MTGLRAGPLTHVFENEIDVLVVVRSMNVKQANNVGVIAKVLQEHDFTKRALCVRLIPESVCVLLCAEVKKKKKEKIYIYKSRPISHRCQRRIRKNISERHNTLQSD